LEALGDNRFGLIPFWHPEWKPPKTDGFIGDNPYAHDFEPNEPEERVQTPQTPPWNPDPDRKPIPGWNPADAYDSMIIESMYSAYGCCIGRAVTNMVKHVAVDEDWLDKSLRALKMPLLLEMASGSRRYSATTESVAAKLIVLPERGDVISVSLLWNQKPETLHDIPIRHVVPKHPTSENEGDPVVFIRGDLKTEYRVINRVDGDLAFVSEITKKKLAKAQRPKPIPHSKYDFVLCQWPKRT
jgi:hypothetical protein